MEVVDDRKRDRKKHTVSFGERLELGHSKLVKQQASYLTGSSAKGS
jgi:hypothetical protein